MLVFEEGREDFIRGQASLTDFIEISAPIIVERLMKPKIKSQKMAFLLLKTYI